MFSNKTLQCRKIWTVLQFYVQNILTHSEEYYHHILFMYFPFRSDREHFSDFPSTYSEIFNDLLVFETTNQNWRITAPLGILQTVCLSNYKKVWNSTGIHLVAEKTLKQEKSCSDEKNEMKQTKHLKKFFTLKGLLT